MKKITSKKYIKSKYVIIFFIVISIFLPTFSKAEQTIKKAEVIRILQEEEYKRESGELVVQQNLELLLLEGDKKGQIVNYYGISDLDLISSNYYNNGDKVFVMELVDKDDNYVYYVTDHVRSKALWYLALFFIFVLIIIGGFKSIKAILSLILSLFIIIKILIPLILLGYNPLIISLIISFLILFLIVYLTEGWKKTSHISVLSIAMTLVITALLTIIFTHLLKLSGASQDGVIYLIEASDTFVNFRGILLAAVIIGSLGVINDMAVGQVASVEQLKIANPKIKKRDLYKAGIKIGRSHLGAIINTLFLAYIGAALPLVMLFTLGYGPFTGFSQIINNEEIAIEILRTLIGVIGICLVMPISTYLSSIFIKNK